MYVSIDNLHFVYISCIFLVDFKTVANRAVVFKRFNCFIPFHEGAHRRSASGFGSV